MDVFKKIVFFLIGLIIFLIIGLEIALAFFLNDRVTQEIKSLLEEKVQSRVEFHQLRASILSDFPNLAIQLDSLGAWEQSHKILSARKIKAELNLLDYILYEYTLDKIEISQTLFHSHVDSMGNKLMIQAKNKNGGPNKKLSLNIPEIVIKDSRVIVSNDFKENWLDISIERGLFELLASDSMIVFLGSAEGNIDSIVNRGDVMDFSIPVKASNANFSIDRKTKTQSFGGVLSLFSIDLNAQGTLVKTGPGNTVDITLESNSENFDEYLKLIPNHRVFDFKQVNPDASVKLYLENTGYISPVNYPNVLTSIEVINAEFARDSLVHTISEVNLKGYFQGGGEEGKAGAKYVIEEGGARYEDNYVLFQGSIENLVDPYLEIDLDSELDLAEIQPIFNYQQNTSGKLSINLALEGKLAELKEKDQNKELVFAGTLNFYDVNVDFPSSKFLDFEVINGEIELKNQKLTLNELTGKYRKSDFSISGEIADYMPLIGQDSVNKSRAVLKLDVDQLAFPETQASSTINFDILPKNLDLDLSFLSGKMLIQGLELSSLELKALLNSDSLKVQKLNFQFDEGNIDLTASARFHQNQILDKQIDLTAKFKTLDLDKLRVRSSPDTTSGQLLDNINLTTSLLADQIRFRNNDFSNVKLKAKMANNEMDFEHFNFDIPYGRIRNDLVLKKSKGQWSVTGSCQLDLYDTEVDSLKNYIASLIQTDDAPKEKNKSNLQYEVRLHVLSPNLSYREMNFSDFDGEYLFTPNGIKIRNTDFEIFEGEFKITGKIEKASTEHSNVYLKFNADQIHLGKVIGQFEPEDKELFSEQNFSGMVGVNGRLLIKYDESLKYNKKDMVGNLNIQLEDGELIKFKPITQSLKFLKKDVTEMIYLSNEKIEVVFHNDEIVIPKTTFASNLSNIELMGYYSETFNFGFDMKISLGQLLFQSQKKKKAQVNKKNAKVGGLQHYLSARTIDGDLKIENIKNKDYQSDMKKLHRRYVIVDSVLNAVKEELR